jgi:phage shock protein A
MQNGCSAMSKDRPPLAYFPANKRKNIWELSSHHHCSIVGTCLTIGEARAVGKKIGAKCPNPEDLDSVIHSILVRESQTKNRVSTLLNKALNKKYESSIRVFQRCNTSLEIKELWKDAFEAGNIPGPYWAALSHPMIDYEVTIKIYSDVHMLSHLVGSSNRADIARLSELEIELANALDKNRSLVTQNNRKINRLRDEIDNHQQKIRNLERKNSNFKARLFVDRPSQSIEEINEEFSHGVLLSGENYTALIAEREHDKSKVTAHNLRLLDDIERLNGEKQDLRSRLQTAQQKLEDSLAELQSANTFIQSFIATSEAPTKRCNLSGKCVLYIGGRAGNICRMCDLVDKMNGRLIHHDGGKEDSMAMLKGAISSADAVIFPTDCVSHSSALEAKKLCKKMIKPLLPIRSSSLSSLVEGLNKIHFESNSQEEFQQKD